jgi:hypothetical protein
MEVSVVHHQWETNRITSERATPQLVPTNRVLVLTGYGLHIGTERG